MLMSPMRPLEQILKVETKPYIIQFKVVRLSERHVVDQSKEQQQAPGELATGK